MLPTKGIIMLEKYKNILDKYLQIIALSKNKDNRIDVMLNVYAFVKEITPDIYFLNAETRNYFIDVMKYYILECESYLPKDYIMDIKPDYDYYNEVNIVSKDFNEKELLDYIVWQTRKYINEEVSFMNVIYPLEKYDLENYCVKASNYVSKLCQNLNIKHKSVKLEPGFIKDSNLYNGYGIHYFNIINLNDKNYLVDCTYSQFFLLKRSILDRIGIVELGGCKPGVFMKMKENRQKLADTLLKKGWIELNDSNLKDYLDGFAISYRNGLFYEKSNDFSYETKYTANDYKNFLKGIDNQLNYESEEVLGYQKKPLSNVTR